MNNRKNILAISGSTRRKSANLAILTHIAALTASYWNVEIYTGIGNFPHFNPDLQPEEALPAVQELRSKIASADGVIICTPEYVFSLPGSLKNAIEWMVSTTVFSEKPVALITAAAGGEKAHESLVLIIKTLYAKVFQETNMLIQGAKGKINDQGEVTDEETLERLKSLIRSFREVLDGNTNKQQIS